MAISEVSKLSLTDEQKKQYEDLGYVVVPGILTPEEIDRFKARMREFAVGNIPPGAEKMTVRDVKVAKGVHKVDDPEHGLWKFLNPDLHDEMFRNYMAHPRLLDISEDILGPDITAFLLMVIYKPPGLEAEHPYHQDAMYFSWGPHDWICGTWLPLDPTDAENGTLVVIPGSHKMDLLPHELPMGELVNFGLFSAQGFDASSEVALEFNPGDCVFFHSRLLHRTGSNRTNRHRRVLTVHMASSKCTLNSDVMHHALKFRPVRGNRYPDTISDVKD